MKKSPNYLANTLLACGALYYAVDLSRSGRTAIDWAVIGAVVAAVLWNLVRLGQRLWRPGGPQYLWHLLRTLLFWGLGVRGLIDGFRAPGWSSDDRLSWQGLFATALLVVAAIDTVALHLKERAALDRSKCEQPV